MGWEEAAKLCETIYGVMVNYHDFYFVCPFCGDRVYEDEFIDWDYSNCPICEEYF